MARDSLLRRWADVFTALTRRYFPACVIVGELMMSSRIMSYPSAYMKYHCEKKASVSQFFSRSKIPIPLVPGIIPSWVCCSHRKSENDFKNFKFFKVKKSIIGGSIRGSGIWDLWYHSSGDRIPGSQIWDRSVVEVPLRTPDEKFFHVWHLTSKHPSTLALRFTIMRYEQQRPSITEASTT